MKGNLFSKHLQDFYAYDEQKRIVMIPNGWKFAKLLLESGRDLGNLARYEKQGSRLAAV